MNDISGTLIVKVRCPLCKQQTVHYDGNYFCSNVTCDWVMNDQLESPVENQIVVTALKQFLSEAEADGDTARASSMLFYLQQRGVDTRPDLLEVESLSAEVATARITKALSLHGYVSPGVIGARCACCRQPVPCATRRALTGQED